jgi:hypothetical protein
MIVSVNILQWDHPNVVMVIYDVTSETSFSSCAKWLERVRSQKPDSRKYNIFFIILLINKNKYFFLLLFGGKNKKKHALLFSEINIIDKFWYLILIYYI